MNEFFDIEDYKIKLNLDNLIVKEFKDLVDADKSKDKKKALAQFLYIYMMYSYKSPYFQYPDETKEKSILKDINEFSTIDTKDPLMTAAITKYKELHITPTMALLNGAKSAMYKISTHLSNTNITSGKDANIVQIQNSIKQISETNNRYKELLKQVEEEQDLNSLARGGRKVGNRED